MYPLSKDVHTDPNHVPDIGLKRNWVCLRNQTRNCMSRSIAFKRVNTLARSRKVAGLCRIDQPSSAIASSRSIWTNKDEITLLFTHPQSRQIVRYVTRSDPKTKEMIDNHHCLSSTVLPFSTQGELNSAPGPRRHFTVIVLIDS